MTEIYRDAGAWGPGKGSDLTALDFDQTIWSLSSRIADIEATPPIGIASVISDSSSFTFVLDNSVHLDPISLPVARYVSRGVWAPLTSYAANDTFRINGKLYAVNHAHTSAASFDAGASDTEGDLYDLLLESPDNVLPAGGTTGQVLRKASDTDYADIWGDLSLNDLTDVETNTALAEGDYLVFRSGIWTNEAFSFEIPAPTSGTGASLGGIFAEPGESHMWLYGIDTDGTPLKSQPAFSDISGTADASQLPPISTLSGTVADSQLLQEKVQAVTSSSGTLTINRNSGHVVECTLHENITSIVIQNWGAANILSKVTIHFINPGSYTVTGYPSVTSDDTKWPGDIEPTITIADTAGNGDDWILLFTTDHAANLYGNVVGQAYGP